MAMRFRTFVQIVMAVLALGICTPQSVCATGTPEAGKTCCCTESPTCGCLPGKPCEQSCALAQVPIFDKQLPGRNTVAPAAHGYFLLFTIAPIAISHPAFVCAFRQGHTNASSPFGGSPPQARLCLWLI
jgi:hypothetical protein